ncbi:beta-galactosidase [Foetidibacter luteolus]|uniref:beta-galactosidase n=1 Tax=Foetidibacter luteolus TaxID=2608880 RepID=UPI00129B6007|nr:beta-galactosidase [Foetidibacter luteolus]
MKALPILLSIFFAFSSTAQQVYYIDITKTPEQAPPVTLDLGGSKPTGESITVNNEYILANGKPFFPVMGEFHFSRYPNEYWEESILKIKAGGINILATYVFWNLHEPIENLFNWTGDYDLKKFISLCAKHHMQVIVRIGPYGHGEIRNGAMPDWLYGRPIDIRTDDPAYLTLVKKYYSEIAVQLKGFLYKDGGNIIGIQLENEYQHAGSTWWLTYPNSPSNYTFPFSQQELTKDNTWNLEKRETYKASGDQHMRTLKQIAKEAGLDVPLYTATGWGYAAIVDKGSLPVSAAYAYPSWGNQEPSPFYLFKDLKRSPDYQPVRYDPQLYPSISAEIGGGIMITNSKRPLVPANSITPLMIRNIGSGSNGIGYYMYHGGSTPVLNGQFMSEEAGELPKISYDFQAPVGEFGQVRSAYNELIPLHLFLNKYGSQLAPMKTYLPETNPVNPTDARRLRYAVRSDGNTGFVFMHNYQDHVANSDLHNLQLSVKTKSGIIRIPSTGSFTLKKESYAILPFNLQAGGTTIQYATVQPLTTFKNAGRGYHVFVSINGFRPELLLQSSHRISALSNCSTSKEKNGLLVKGNADIFSFQLGEGDSSQTFLVIPQALAKKTYALPNGLLFSGETILPLEDGFELISRGKNIDTVLFYPATNISIQSPNVTVGPLPSFTEKSFSAYSVQFKQILPPVKIEQPRTTSAVVSFNEHSFDGLNDIFLHIDYRGDKAQALLNGHLVADHFYYGAPWEIGLKRLKTTAQQPLFLFFHPLSKTAPCIPYIKKYLPDFGDKKDYLQVNAISVVAEYKCKVELR